MYNDCEICGKGGRRLELFAGSAWAILCDTHAHEFDDWAVMLPEVGLGQQLSSDYGVLRAHAQGGKECREQMKHCAARIWDIQRELWKAARDWIKKAHAAYIAKLAVAEEASKDQTIIGR